jgi:hypothetical protein
LTPEGEAELIRRVCEAAAESTAVEAGRIVRRLDSGMVLGRPDCWWPLRCSPSPAGIGWGGTRRRLLGRRFR